MFGINLKHSLATVAVAAGLLAAAGPASAATHQSGVIGYNGHAGLGAAVTDGTSNTIAFAERAAAPRGFSIDIGTSENIASDGRGSDSS
jgi:Protein of unknown function (DUF1559)